MDFSTILTFVAAFFVFAVSPGPDNMAIVARTISHGAPSGLAYGTGTVVGILIYLSLSTFGLSIIASEMSLMMAILRYGGAAYLIWMGFKMWTANPAVADAQPGGNQRGLLATFAAGVALNLGNPKMPLFYLALLPNTVGVSMSFHDVGVLAVVILAVEVVVIGGHVILASRARSLLREPRSVRRANRAAGGAMVGAGVLVATR